MVALFKNVSDIISKGVLVIPIWREYTIVAAHKFTHKKRNPSLTDEEINRNWNDFLISKSS